MTSYSALAPVSAGVYTALNVVALTAIAPGGVCDDVAQNTGFPFVLFEVSERRQPAFGTKPGTAGAVSEVDLTLHVYSQYEGYHEAQVVLAKAVELLTTPPAVSGYASWAIFFEDAIPVGDELVAGVKCKELVQKARLYVEAQ